MSHPLHQQVRQAWAFRCGYCGVSEAAVGGELTVDHYQPRAADGSDELSNLGYACSRYNQYKGDFWPTAQQAAAGFVVLHPNRHDTTEHWRENELTGELEALTATGAFHLKLLHLNRPQLLAQRLERRVIALLRQRVDLLEAQAEQREQTTQALQQYLRFLLSLSKLRPPID